MAAAASDAIARVRADVARRKVLDQVFVVIGLLVMFAALLVLAILFMDLVREGSYAMGATRFQTATRVVVPGALSGIAAAYILGISRAVGETMVVAVAAGLQPNLTWDPTEPAATITAFIVQVSLGDLPHDSIGYQSIFAAGLVLLILTLIFNIAGFTLTRRFREAY